MGATSRLMSLAARVRRKTAHLIASLGKPPANADPAAIEAHRLEAMGFPRSLFDAGYYLEQNPDVAASGADPFDHFLRFGLAEGRRARFFDAGFYLGAYPDLARAGVEPHGHYRTWGQAEQRQARLVTLQFRRADRGLDYEDWFAGRARARWAATLDLEPRTPDGRPLISVVMPVYDADLYFLDRAIQSVLSQSYRAIELCLADDASTDPRVRERLRWWAAADDRVKCAFRDANGHISAATNSAIALASGRYVAFMDQDDELAEGALASVAQHLIAHPGCVLVYSDEDKIDAQGRLSEPHFKSDFNYELLLAQNYINHLTVARTEEVRRLGGLREGFEGAQDHDFLLRLSRIVPRDAIHHLPEVLYHWRKTPGSTAAARDGKPYVAAAGVRALQEHCLALGVAAEVTPIESLGYYRVSYALTDQPKVSVIIPTRDRVALLRQCVDSLLARTAWRNLEVIVADNDSREPETLGYFEELRGRGVQVVACPGPFNFSRINNAAVAAATGDFLLLLNNDTEVTEGDWLTEMLRYGVQPDIGCVGARLWFPDRTLQHGGVIVGIQGVAGHAHKDLPEGSGGYFCRAVLPQQFSAVTAACLLVRRSVFHEVGGFDEALAVTLNDVDFCLKVEAAGYRNVWTPYAELIHHESKSRGQEDTPEKQARFRQEVELMQTRWGARLRRDPYYNPHLTLDREDFSFSPATRDNGDEPR